MAKELGSSSAEGDRGLLVHAYVDGELDVASALRAKEQIEGDPRLGAELAAISALQGKLRDTFLREPVPLTLRSRITKAAGTQRSWGRPTWMAMAASILMAAVISGSSTWLVLRSPAGDQIRGEVVDSHMRALLSQRPTDVESSERHTVKPWFNTRLPTAPRVVNLSSDGFPLIGARIDVVGGSPVPTLVYGRRLHVISLTAVPDGTKLASGSSSDSVRGFNLLSWIDGDTRFWAASDLNTRELEAFAKLFRSSSSG